jgi:hypothetical protein
LKANLEFLRVFFKVYCAESAFCAVSQEFAKIALDRIVKSEAGTRGFAKAARVLHVSIEEVEQAVAALTTLFARAVRLHLQHAELLSLFSDAGKPPS